MVCLLWQTSILCIILMLSLIAVYGESSAEDDFESADTATGRRLLGTSYTMPKLNFSELIHHVVLKSKPECLL